jgi:thioredoxin 1
MFGELHQPQTQPLPANAIWVACCCAAWCRTCEDYRQTFKELEQKWLGQAVLVWVDVEDHANLLGDVQVDNFPTLLIGKGATPYFWGAVLPQLNAAHSIVLRMVTNRLLELHPEYDEQAYDLASKIWPQMPLLMR